MFPNTNRSERRAILEVPNENSNRFKSSMYKPVGGAGGKDRRHNLIELLLGAVSPNPRN
jgi:hypothetical protein